MIQVRFRVNLGSSDAAKLELDFRKCTAGAEVMVQDTVAASLEAAGIVHPLPLSTRRPAKVVELPVEVRADPAPEPELVADPVADPVAADDHPKHPDHPTHPDNKDKKKK